MKVRKLYDVHIHLGPSIPWKPHFNPSTTLDAVLQFMKDNNISKAVIFPNPSIGVEYPGLNDIILDAYKQYPDIFIPFGRIDPRYKRLALYEIERLYRREIRGIKLHPIVECFCPSHTFFFEIYKKIEDCNLIILTHTGKFFFGKAIYWKEVCDKFEITIILTHVNEYCEDLLKSYPRVYADISGRKFIEENIDVAKFHKKLLFGSDFPYNTDINASLQKLASYNLKPHQERNILYRNLKRILKL